MNSELPADPGPRWERGRPSTHLLRTCHLSQDTRGASKPTPPAGEGHRDAGWKPCHPPHIASPRSLTVRSKNHAANQTVSDQEPSRARRGQVNTVIGVLALGRARSVRSQGKAK